MRYHAPMISEGSGYTLVIGGGVAGLATAWGLARSGAGPVAVIEREASLGFWSSGRNAGILRTAIHAPATRRLALQSQALLENLPPELAAHAPGPILDKVGLVLCEGSPGLPEPLWLDDLAAAGRVQALEPQDLKQRVPYFEPEGSRAWWLPDSGRIKVSNLMAALEGACREMGVRFWLNSTAVGLIKDASGQVTGVALEQDRRVIRAERIVLAPGAWVQPFAEHFGLEFPARTTRRHLFYAVPESRWSASDPVVWDDAAGFYFSGTDTGEMLLSLCDGDDADPQHLIQDPLLPRLMQRRVQESLTSLGSFDWRRSLVGIRTVSEDDVPVISKHPGQENLYWVAALGGHGVTLSLGLGELAARIITGDSIDPGMQNALAYENPERDYRLRRDYPAL